MDFRFRRKLTSPRTESLGLFWMAAGSAAVLELCVRSGPDAVVLDAQHGLWDRHAIENAVAVLSPHCAVLIRVTENSARSIGEALDSGADGIIVPMVEDDVQAAAAVEAARFPPNGVRSAGGIRPLGTNFGEYYQKATEGTVVGVMIETMRSVRNAEAIVRTRDLDMVLIGTGDLALSINGNPSVDQRHEDACQAVKRACGAAGISCAIFTNDVDSAIRRREDGFDVTVVANDIGIIDSGFANAMSRFRGDGVNISRSGYFADAGSKHMNTGLLTQLATALGSGDIRIVDLTQTLKVSTPVIDLPKEIAPSNPFRIMEISRYDERGPGWYWNNISMGEHTGTHFDAPVHWITGRHYADGFTDTIPVQRLIAPACVIDCSVEARADQNFLLKPEFIRKWEAEHGRIPQGAWVLMRTDWSKRADPAAFLNVKDDGPHVPGPSAEAIKFLIEERNINGWGVEAVGTDAGQAFAFEPMFPAHNLLHGANKLGLASLCNLDQLPPTGALLITPPLKIEKGSGSPLRVLALVP